MHETILKTVTVAVVGGLIVYWLTSKHSAEYAGKHAPPDSYSPLYGDVRMTTGKGTCACCQCCGLPVPENTTVPLATDYLDCAPNHRAAISEWNLGVSLQVSCKGLDANVYREETATAFPFGVTGPRSTPRPVVVVNPISCNPCVPLQVCCTEVV